MKTPHPQEPLFPEPKTLRVTVPVSPEVHEAFKRLAAASKTSVGKAMGEWMSDTVEGVEAMADLVEKARQSPKLAIREVQAYVLGLTDMTDDLIEQVKRGAHKGGVGGDPAGGEAPAPTAGGLLREAKKRGAKQLTPPVSNTGGKVLKKGKG
jgi:hypothetical protein